MTLKEHLQCLPIQSLKDEISVWFNDEHISGQVENFINSQYADKLVFKCETDDLNDMRVFYIVDRDTDEKYSGGVWDFSIDYVVEFLRLRGIKSAGVNFDLMVELLYDYIYKKLENEVK